MHTPADSIRLSVGGVSNARWTGFSVDSDLLIAADAFELELHTDQSGTLPVEVAEGAPCQLQLDDDLVLTGRLDEVEHEVSRSSHAVRVIGRDLAGFLVDCSTPFVSMRDATLQQIVDQVAKPLGIAKVRLQVPDAALRRRVQIQPGQSAWEVLLQVAEANGVWPWVDPDGTLIVGGPDYSVPTVGRLQLHRDGRGNNIERLTVRRSIAQRYSEVTVLGQHGAFDADDWESNRTTLKALAKDEALARRGIFRPRVVVDSACDSTSLATSRAKKLLADSLMEGFEGRAIVPGWRAPNGAVWAAGQRVEVTSEPHALDDVYFIMGRTLRLTRQHGAITELRLREDKAWILGQDAGKKGKKRQPKDDGGQYL